MRTGQEQNRIGRSCTPQAAPRASLVSAQPIAPEERPDQPLAVEVVVLFDSTILAVKHLPTPAESRGRGVVRGRLFSSCAALLRMLVMSVVHARADGTGSLLWAALSALLFGINRLLLHRADAKRQENEFTIGSAAGATFHLDSAGLPSDRFPMVRWNGVDYEFVFTRSMSGELIEEGALQPLRELEARALPASGIPGALALPLRKQALILVHHANCSFLIQWVKYRRGQAMAPRLEWRVPACIGIVAAGAALLLGMLCALPPNSGTLALDGVSNQRLARLFLEAPAAPDIPDLEALWFPPRPSHRPRTCRSSVIRPKIRTQGWVDAVDLATWKELHEAAIANSFGCVLPGTDSQIDNRRTPPSRLFQKSSDAADLRIPRNNLRGLNRAFSPSGAKVTAGIPEVQGTYDPALMYRILRLHINEVRDCHAQELLHNPRLSGRIMLNLTIGTRGDVLFGEIGSSTVRSHALEHCLVQAAYRWEFPSPPAGSVVASYPIVFK